MAIRRPPKRLYRPGDKIGGYKIQRYIGGGGFGETYKAKDPTFDTVAIKFVKTGNAIKEAKSLRNVRSKFAPEVYRVIEDDEDTLPYIVMEYVHGKTLEDFLDNHGPLLAREWWRTLRPLLMALDFFHSTKDRIIHRDIKPANILLRDGNDTKPVLIDLGASTQQANLEPTQIGTKGYVHPDVLGCGSDDPRRDIAALAIVSYEAIYGYGESDDWNTMKKIMQTSQDPLEKAIGLGFNALADVPESVSKWLARIVEELLSTDSDHAKWPDSSESSSIERSVSQSSPSSNLDVASSMQLDVQSALEVLEERYALPSGCLALMHNQNDRVPGSQNLYAYRKTQQWMPQTVMDSESISDLTDYLRAELGLHDKRKVKCVRPDGSLYNGKTLVRTMRKEYEE